MSVVLLLWLILSRIVREDCEEGQGRRENKEKRESGGGDRGGEGRKERL